MESLLLTAANQELPAKIYSVSNSRRVLKCLKKFTDAQQKTNFLGCDAMYAHNVMDGKFKIFSYEDLTQSGVQNDAVENLVNVQKLNPLPESHYVECQFGVNEAEYFNLNGNEFIVCGQDDGTIQIYDYSENKGKASYDKPIFKVTKEPKNASDAKLIHPDEVFAESLYEHTESAVVIEKNYKNHFRFATAGKDSSVCFWKFTEKDEPVTYESCIEKYQFNQGSTTKIGSVTALKWLEENVVVVSLNDGTLQTWDVREKPDTKCSLLYRGDCAIWDLALWITQSATNILIAEDSGKVNLIDPRQTLQCEGHQQSALKLSIDHISKTSQNLLSVGYSSSIQVLDLNIGSQDKIKGDYSLWYL
ncbi:UNKNOWN [Stylonychia lemnae]|uniref:Uncharacterized protein n=1 Tax=Stylonychia lemnae TaxID=5949 RepID=A0A078A3G2_STYLE|nr:UNKNOWN [Stylonychia lemnae]|eukprot:CDW76332.1 UNKNOWN [Stylonychia lemnae]